MPMPMAEIELALMAITHPVNSWGVKRIENDKAVGDMIWLPRSQVTYEVKSKGIHWDTAEVTMPEWLAKDRGLI